jgi:adenylate cyclase
LNVYLTAMTDVILDRRGVIDKYEGDAIMAFWGAPQQSATHAADACLATLDQVRALSALNERFQGEGRPELRVRAGLNSGPAVVGNMGSTRRFSYTAMGDTVNLASRLEGANKFFGTGVMLSEAVRAAAGDAIVTRKLGSIVVVGKRVATLVHELVGRPGEVTDAELERIARYHGALELFEHGEAGEALRRFEALLEGADDPVIAKYAAKCREVQASGASWDGVWTLLSKG